MRVGEIIADRFRIEARAGAGAMGVVYRAVDTRMNRWVAVKALTLTSEDALARFEREASVLATLRHPNIVEYIAHGRTPSGEPFLVMAWLEGQSLKEIIESQSLLFSEIVDVGIGIALALALTHANGIVHRDLKPANVYLVGRSSADVRVVDFGIARIRKGGPSLTGTGEMLGSPGYMSPEQARGERSLDARSDLFSLGAILFRCLTGRLPFERDDTLSMLVALTTEQAPPIALVAPATPPRLARLVDALLAFHPDARPTDAASVHRELSEARNEVGGGGPAPSASPGAPLGLALAPQPGLAPKAPPSKPSRTWIVLVGVVGLVVVLGVVAIAAVSFFGARPETKSASDDDDDDAPKRKKKKPAPVASVSATPLVCPGALGCVAYELDDKSRHDGFAVIPDAVAFARKYHPDAQYASESIFGVSETGIDFDAGSTIQIDLTTRIMIQIRRHSMTAWASPFEVTAHARPGCPVSVAYRTATANGLVAHSVVNVMASPPNNPGLLSVDVLEPLQQVTLDLLTCTVDRH